MKKTHLLILFALFLLSCQKKAETQIEKTTTPQQDKPVEVSIKRLEYENFNYELISNGTIVAVNKANLRFQSQEIIRKIYVKNGQQVTQGQKIAELDPFRLEIALNQAKEALDRAELDLRDVLIGQGYSDTLNVPVEVMRIAKIRSNYEQSFNNHAIAAYNLRAATLYAPFAGTIANLTNKEFNQPDADAFCMVIDNRRPEVVFNILENELPLVRLQDPVFISPFSQPDYTIEGRISEINPLVDKNGMVRIKAVIGNRDGQLYEGMNVKIRIQRLLGRRLVVPKTAVVLRSNKKVVFTVKENRAQWVYVQTAQENSGNCVVTDGLSAGDSVIYKGNISLAHDTPIQIKAEK